MGDVCFGEKEVAMKIIEKIKSFFRKEFSPKSGLKLRIGLLVLASFSSLFLAFVLIGITDVLFSLLHELFPLVFSNIDTRSRFVDPSRFMEFWQGGVFVFLIHVSVYTVFALTTKIKIRLDLLIALTVTFLLNSGEFSRPTGGGWFNPGWGHSIANIYFFAMITFTIFTISAILFDKLSHVKEILKILSSIAVSVVLSYGISLIIWGIL